MNKGYLRFCKCSLKKWIEGAEGADGMVEE
jgi:hypothetical protein